MEHTVIGLFNSLSEAQRVVTELIEAGFKRSEISLVANDETNLYARYLEDRAEGDDAVKAGESASFGAAIGALTGALVGLNALAIPGIGPVMAAGPLVAALGGGAVGVVASLVKTGLPEQDAQYYAEGIRRGGTLVTVNTSEDMVPRALDIMNRHGAIDVHRRAEEWKREGWTGFDANARPYNQGTARQAQ
jgi:hypothetical protein